MVPTLRRAAIPPLLAVLLVTGLASPAVSEDAGGDRTDPAFVPWTDELPPLPAGYEPTAENLCVEGQTRCVDAVIKEMTRRFDRLASRCDHDVIFALNYLRTTEEYRRAVDEPGFFADPAFVNHEDVVFAAYYFRAFDAWHAGTPAAVPPAWQVAFDAADRRLVSGSGNMLLGISAHVNRDLPFVLEAIGLVAPDGTSRKADHDRVNRFLNRVGEAQVAEISRRFDPSVDDAAIAGTTLDGTAVFQLIAGWREEAWRNAERLATAPTPADRALVARSIEDAAAAEARSLVTMTAYRAPLSTGEQREAWCAAHWRDA